MYISKSRQEKDFQDFTQTLETISGLAIMIGDAERDLEVFFKKGQAEQLTQYKMKSDDIRLNLIRMKAKFRNTDYYLYIRIASNIFEFCENTLDLCLASEEADPEQFRRQQLLFQAFESMETYITQWISQYITIEEAVLEETILEQNEMYNTIFICMLMVILLAYAFSFQTARIITRQLDAMVSHAEKLTNATWNIQDLPQDNMRELNVLSKSMNVMKESLNRYFIELMAKSDIEIKYRKELHNNAEKSKLLLQVRYQSLARRLDPHFLFNSLNIVYRKCMFLEQDDITDVIAALADVLRYNLEIDTEFVLLSQELKVLESYLFIHTARFDDKIRIQRNIQCKPEELYITPFVLQPLIECIFAEKRQDPTTGGALRINIGEGEDKSMTIAVTLESVNILPHCPGISSTRIKPDDLSILKERLSLVYHDQSTLNEIDREGYYSVSLTVPLLKTIPEVTLKNV